MFCFFLNFLLISFWFSASQSHLLFCEVSLLVAMNSCYYALCMLQVIQGDERRNEHTNAGNDVEVETTSIVERAQGPET